MPSEVLSQKVRAVAAQEMESAKVVRLDMMDRYARWSGTWNLGRLMP